MNALQKYLAFSRDQKNNNDFETLWQLYNQTGGSRRGSRQGKSNIRKTGCQRLPGHREIWCGAGVYLLDFKKIKGLIVPCLVVFRERNRSYFSGHDVWEEPGGKLEPGMESIAHGAQAELREESRNLLDLSPEILTQPLSSGESPHIDVWSRKSDDPRRSPRKGFRVYVICLQGLKKSDYNQNVQILEKRDEVPWSWRETNGMKWIPLTEFAKKKLVRKQRATWRDRTEYRAVVKDSSGQKIEVGGRLMLGMRTFGGLDLCARVLADHNNCWSLSDLQSEKQKGFLKGTKNYSL